MLNTPFDCFLRSFHWTKQKSTPVINCYSCWFENSNRHVSTWWISRINYPGSQFSLVRLSRAQTAGNERGIYTRTFDIESEEKEKKNRSSTLVFALRRRHTRAPHLKARPHAPRVINTQVIRECRTDEEDRWAEAWFFLVIKNYAPRPVCVKARGFVNIFRPVCAFGLAKRRDKVSAYFPGSPLGYHPNGTKPLSLLFIHTFSSSFLSFVLSRFSQRPTPSPFSVRQTIIFPDFPPGILISCAGKERQGLIDAEIAPSSRDNVPGSNRQPKQAWVISRRANYCVERVWI